MASNAKRSSSELVEAWQVESEAFGWEPDDLDTAACAELADELSLFRIQADADPNYDDSLCEWYCYIADHDLWLPLEQSCHDGVLLPTDQRALRLESCPEQMLRRLRWFFEICPAHIKHHLALIYYLLGGVNYLDRSASIILAGGSGE